MGAHRSTKDHLKLYCSTSAFPGIKYSQQADSRFGKIFWLLVTLTGFCIGTWVSTLVIRQFITTPTYTTISLSNIQQGIRFPSATVCLLFRTTKAKLEAIGVHSVEDVEYLYHSLITFKSPITLDFEESKRILSAVNETRIMREMLTKRSVLDVFYDITPTCGDINASCTVGPASQPSICSVSKPLIAANGPCYAFNEIQNYTQKVPGTFGKALIQMRLPTRDQLPDTSFYQHKFDGVQFFTSIESASLEMSPIIIGRGQAAFISLNYDKSISISNPEKPCLFASEFPFPEYSFELCGVHCMNNKTVEICGCMEVNSFICERTMKMTNSITKFCIGDSFQFCNMSAGSPTNEVNKQAMECERSCPKPCEKEIYSATVSYAPLLDRGDPNVSDSVSMLMYFPSLSSTVAEEKRSFQWQTLVSNIGGIYGLWVGAILSGVLHTFYSLAIWAFDMVKFRFYLAKRFSPEKNELTLIA